MNEGNEKNRKEKIIPKSLAIKRRLIKQGKQEIVRFSAISLILSVIALVIEGYLTIKYFGTDPYANYALLLLFLGLIGISGAYWLNPKSLFVLNDYYLKDVEKTGQFIVSILMTILCIAIIQVVLKTTFRLALSLTDLLMYFIASAIVEELFFRMFLVSYFKLKTRLKSFGIVISAFVFMLFHIPTYWPSVEMLSAMFLGGCVFGAAFLLTKDITAGMIAHLTINTISFVVSTGGLLLFVK